MADNRVLALGAVIFLIFAGFLVFTFTQGSLFPGGENCEFKAVTNPDTGATYESLEQYKKDVTSLTDVSEANFDSFINKFETQFSDVDGDGEGELQLKPKQCVKGGQRA